MLMTDELCSLLQEGFILRMQYVSGFGIPYYQITMRRGDVFAECRIGLDDLTQQSFILDWLKQTIIQRENQQQFCQRFNRFCTYPQDSVKPYYDPLVKENPQIPQTEGSISHT